MIHSTDRYSLPLRCVSTHSCLRVLICVTFTIHHQCCSPVLIRCPFPSPLLFFDTFSDDYTLFCFYWLPFFVVCSLTWFLLFHSFIHTLPTDSPLHYHSTHSVVITICYTISVHLFVWYDAIHYATTFILHIPIPLFLFGPVLHTVHSFDGWCVVPHYCDGYYRFAYLHSSIPVFHWAFYIVLHSSFDTYRCVRWVFLHSDTIPFTFHSVIPFHRFVILVLILHHSTVYSIAGVRFTFYIYHGWYHTFRWLLFAGITLLPFTFVTDLHLPIFYVVLRCSLMEYSVIWCSTILPTTYVTGSWFPTATDTDFVLPTTTSILPLFDTDDRWHSTYYTGAIHSFVFSTFVYSFPYCSVGILFDILFDDTIPMMIHSDDPIHSDTFHWWYHSFGPTLFHFYRYTRFYILPFIVPVFALHSFDNWPIPTPFRPYVLPDTLFCSIHWYSDTFWCGVRPIVHFYLRPLFLPCSTISHSTGWYSHSFIVLHSIHSYYRGCSFDWR